MPNTGWCQFWDPTAVFDAQSGDVLLLRRLPAQSEPQLQRPTTPCIFGDRQISGRRFLSARRIENLDAILNESGDYPPSIGVAGQCRITARSTDGGVSFHSAVRRTPFYYVIF